MKLFKEIKDETEIKMTIRVVYHEWGICIYTCQPNGELIDPIVSLSDKGIVRYKGFCTMSNMELPLTDDGRVVIIDK